MTGGDRPLLEVTGLTVRFPVPRGLGGILTRRPAKAVHAVDGVSFTIASGEILALVGESGCGKTTTAQAVLRLVGPSSGSVRIGGEDVSRLPSDAMRRLRRRAQLVYQDPYESLDPRFTVRRTVEEPLVAHRIGGSAAQRRHLVVDQLSRVGLTPPEVFLDRYPHELSGGQRQRVAIAAALVLRPELVVADEPVSMLDVSVRTGILGLLDALRKEGLGVLLVTHDLATAVRFADRIAVMYLGLIVECGPAAEVANDPQHPYTRALISVAPRPDPDDQPTAPALEGDVPDAAALPSGCRFHPRCPAVMARCVHDDPSDLTPAGAPGHSAACWLVRARAEDETHSSKQHQ